MTILKDEGILRSGEQQSLPSFSIETSILSAWVAGILALFVLLCTQLLPEGFLAFAAFAVVGVACLLWRTPTAVTQLHPISLNFALRLLAPAVLIATFVYSRWGFNYYLWDDLSHWARATKFIAERREIFTAPYIATPTYPPGIPLLHYSLISVLGYQERFALFAQFSFLAVCLAAIASPVSSRNAPLGVATIFTIVAAIYLLRFGLDDTTADVAMGLLLASICIIAYTERNTFAILSANSLLIAFLVTLKQMGLPFAFVGVGISGLMILLRHRELDIERPLRACVFSIALLSAAALLPHFLWQAVSNAGALANSPLSGLSQIWQALGSGTMSPRFAATLNEFLYRMVTTEPLSRPQQFGVPGVWGVSPIVLLVSMTAISFGAALLVPGRRVSGVVISGVLAIGMCGYILLLFSLYLSHFTEYEGTALASFERYSAGYYLAWMSFTVVMIFLAIGARLGTVSSAVLTISIIGGGVYLLQPLGDVIARELDYRQREVIVVRHEVQDLAAIAKRNLNDGDKVYFIKQGDTGFAFFAFQFEMMNHRTQDQCWSLGSPSNAGDIWSCPIRLEDALRNYSLLVIAGADQIFWGSYRRYFEPSDEGRDGVYRVTFDDGNLVSLRRVYP